MTHHPDPPVILSKGLSLGLAFLFVLFISDTALAVDLEYYTYNGFEAVTLAFRRIALIFGARDFTKLFAIVCGAGIVFAGVAHYARAFVGFHASPFAWAGPILVGVALYLGLFVSTGSLTVYDPVKNRFDRIDGIPDAIVLTAGALNKVERILVDVVDATAPAGVGYKDGAGGLGFYGVQETLQRGVKDTYLTQNLGEYVTKCLSFELVRPGTTLRIEDLVNNTTDFLPQLAEAASPSVYCLHFDAATPNGTALTCADAWAELRAWFADAGNYAEDVRRAAANAGFDPTSAAELARYRSLVTNTLAEYAALAGITPERVSQQGTIARQLFEFVKDGAPSVAVSIQANKNLGTSLFGVGVVANEWIPVVRAVMTSVVVGMLPFLALFLPSPFFKRVLSLFLGLFVFLAAWGVTDAVAHSFALEYADQYFEMVRQSGLGLATWLNFPDVTTKTLALYGLIRMTGAVLASVIASTLVGFGGHALATLASHLTQPVQHQGAAAGQAALTPEGRAHTLDAVGHAAVASRAWDNGGKHTFTNVVGSGVNARFSNLGSNLGYDGPEDAFATSFTGTRMQAGTVAGRAAGFGNTGYEVRAGSRHVARGSTIEGAAHHEARDVEGGLRGGRVELERSGATLSAARLGGEIRGVQAAGGPDRYRDAKAKAAASSTAHEGTLGSTPEDAGERARRKGETAYEGDVADFAWRDQRNISDQELGRRTGRLSAQRAFHGARTLTRTAGELGLTDDELVERSAGAGAARQAGDALTHRKWGAERIAAAQLFGNQQNILQEGEKRAMADRLGVPLEELQAMGYRLGHGALTPEMADTFNEMLGAQGRGQRVAAGESASWVLDRNYDLAFLETTRGVTTSEVDAARTRKGSDHVEGDHFRIGDSARVGDEYVKGDVFQKGDRTEIGDFHREQGYREVTDLDGHRVEYRHPRTGDVMAGHRERVLTETTGDPLAGVTMVQRTPITQFELFRQSRFGAVSEDFDNRHTLHAGVTTEGSLTTGNIDRWWGRDAAVGFSLAGKSVDEVANFLGKIGNLRMPLRGARGTFLRSPFSPAPLGTMSGGAAPLDAPGLSIRSGLPPSVEGP